LKRLAKLAVTRNAMLAEQLHDDGGTKDEDDLNQSLRRKDTVERRHVSRCPLL
jgi:hypothetical protein